MYVDSKYANITSQFFKFNRTSGVLNVTWISKVDVDDLKVRICTTTIYMTIPLQLHVEGYQFLSNEFRKGIIEFTLPFCDFLSGKRTDFDANNILHKCGEIKVCPIRKVRC